MTLYRIQSEKCSLEIGEIWKVMVSYKNNNNNSDETLPFYHSHSNFVMKQQFPSIHDGNWAVSNTLQGNLFIVLRRIVLRYLRSWVSSKPA